MIFWLAGSIGQLFSGFLQAAAYTHLNGVDGHAGWRWLFIIDGIITLPLAILGFIFFPNLPQDDQKTWWITEDEYELSKKRMKAVGRAGKTPWVRFPIYACFNRKQNISQQYKWLVVFTLIHNMGESLICLFA
jgi:ACS family pantothenate transporter-like MFS transporter